MAQLNGLSFLSVLTLLFCVYLFFYLGVRWSVGFESHTWLGAAHERLYTATARGFCVCVIGEAVNLLLETVCCLLVKIKPQFIYFVFLLLL